MDDVPFKPRAYEKAAQAIESHDRPLDAVYRAGGVKALREIPGIGTSMAEKLEELITTGKCKLREEYHRRMPVDLAALTALEGVGPKAVQVLSPRLGVRPLAHLEAAARAGKVRDLPHFGEKSEQKILKALAFAQTSGQRTPLAAVRPVIDELAAALARAPRVQRVEVAGSIRRRKETVGDADLLALARTAEAAIAAFAQLPAGSRPRGARTRARSSRRARARPRAWSSRVISAATSRRRPTGPTARTRSRRWRARPGTRTSSTSPSPITP